MLCRLPSRPPFAAALLAAGLVWSLAAQAQAGPSLHPRLVLQQRPAVAGPQRLHTNPGNRIGPQGEHLAQWMSRHQNMPLAEQQRALEQEPGFRTLPPETQQRMHNRLTELNNMSPERRQRLIARTEAMERLAPEQRQQVRSAMQQLASLPEDRRREVARAFRELRSLPTAQRQAAFNSNPRYAQPFTPQERATLGNLLSVEPYLPPPQPRRPTFQPAYPPAVAPYPPSYR